MLLVMRSGCGWMFEKKCVGVKGELDDGLSTSTSSLADVCYKLISGGENEFYSPLAKWKNFSLCLESKNSFFFFSFSFFSVLSLFSQFFALFSAQSKKKNQPQQLDTSLIGLNMGQLTLTSDLLICSPTKKAVGNFCFSFFPSFG